MESLGDKFKNTRNEKNLSLEQVSKETTISIRYLEAMETENFSVFPGEPYIIGFLRNYSDYLDLDVQKILSLYRALRIQEQPVPVDQLLKKKLEFPKFIIPVLIGLFILGAGGWAVYTFIIRNQNTVVRDTPAARTSVEYMMEGNSMDRRLYKNDAVLFSIDNETYRLVLTNLGETVSISVPGGGSRNIDLGQEVTVDLNYDGIFELRITAADFAKNDPDMGALLHFILTDVAVYTGADIDYTGTGVSATSPVSSTTVIPPTFSAYPFTLQVSFQGYCMFRWEILNERDRQGINQNFFQRGETLDIQAQNTGIRIWSSNAQAARFQVIGGGQTFPVDIGAAGEVVVVEIRWVRDDDSRYRLILVRLEG